MGDDDSVVISKFWTTICRFLFFRGLHDAIYWSNVIDLSCDIYDCEICINEIVKYRWKGSIIFTMVCFIFVGDLILFVFIILMISLTRMAHVVVIFNANIIIIIIIFVVTSIFTFVGYYIRGDVSSENFKLLKVLFLRLIVLILLSYRVVMFIGWERIGVMSMCLIRY